MTGSARDRVTQVVLAVLISTFVVAVAGLRGMGTGAPVPVVVIALALAMGLASAGALLAFVGHMVRGLRIDSMMLAVHRESAAVIENTYPSIGERSRQEATPRTDGDGTSLPARTSGFVRMVRAEMLVTMASRRGLFVQSEVRPGDHVVTGAPLATVWCQPDARPDVLDDDELDEIAEELGEAVEIGFERTSEQDAAFGFRQLTDIAVKAISPSINDPVTASHAIGYCADLLTRVQSRDLGPDVHRDDQDAPRLRTAARDLRYFLDLVCAPIRRFGRTEPTVLTALLRMLRDCALAARDDVQRREIARQVRLIVEEMGDDLGAPDAQRVTDMAHRVQLALEGRILEAYRDRAGETRSD